MKEQLVVRDIRQDEAPVLGKLMVDVYSRLEGFPSPSDAPDYYRMLSNIGSFAQDGLSSRVLVAGRRDAILGGVVYFGDMSEYGSGGTATLVRNASGIRLLGVAPSAREKGVGKALTLACVDRARRAGHEEVILHTTHAMRQAWRLYLSIGFVRSEELDYVKSSLHIFGFRLKLQSLQ